jgi:hypothetical protein
VATAAFASELRLNNSKLKELAIAQLPLFGVDPASIRTVVLNSTAVSSMVVFNTTNSTNGTDATNATNIGNGTTVYLISVQYTATTVSLLETRWESAVCF